MTYALAWATAFAHSADLQTLWQSVVGDARTHGEGAVSVQLSAYGHTRPTATLGSKTAYVLGESTLARPILIVMSAARFLCVLAQAARSAEGFQSAKPLAARAVATSCHQRLSRRASCMTTVASILA